MKNTLAENMRRFGTKNLTEDKSKPMGYYRVGGVKYDADPQRSSEAYVRLYIKDAGSGEVYVEAEGNGSTLEQAYEAAAKLFIMQRDRIKNDPQHDDYRKRNFGPAIELIQPLKLEEL